MSARNPIERRLLSSSLECGWRMNVPFAGQHADNAGLAQPAMHLETPLRQLFGHQVGGAGFLERQFGMRVNVTADRHQVFLRGFDFGDQTHLTCSFT